MEEEAKIVPPQTLYDDLVARMVRADIAEDDAMGLARNLHDRAMVEDISFEGAKIRADICSLDFQVKKLLQDTPTIDDDRPLDWLYQEILQWLREEGSPAQGC